MKKKSNSGRFTKGNLHRFKPGQSGNPGGRPKKDEAAEIACQIFENNQKEIYNAMLKALKKGDPKVFSALADRGYGKARQAIDLSVEPPSTTSSKYGSSGPKTAALRTPPGTSTIVRQSQSK